MKHELDMPTAEEGEDVAEQGMEDAQQQGANQGPEANVEKALTYIYGDAETFSSLIEMLKTNKSSPEKGIAQATVMIIGKLEADVGELPQEDLSNAGIAVVMALLDLADKAGAIDQVTEEIGSAAWGEAIKLYVKKNPGKIDISRLQEIAGQGMNPGEQAPQTASNQEGLLA